METEQRKRTRWLSVRVPAPIIIATGACFVLFGALWLLSERERGRFDRTQRQMISFSNALSHLSSIDGRIPGSNLEDAIKAVQSNAASRERMRNCPLILEGRDAWGTRWVYTVDPTGKNATITSAGPDRKYDGGQGDDLSCTAVIGSE